MHLAFAALAFRLLAACLRCVVWCVLCLWCVVVVCCGAVVCWCGVGVVVEGFRTVELAWAGAAYAVEGVVCGLHVRWAGCT